MSQLPIFHDTSNGFTLVVEDGRLSQIMSKDKAWDIHYAYGDVYIRYKSHWVCLFHGGDFHMIKRLLELLPMDGSDRLLSETQHAMFLKLRDAYVENGYDFTSNDGIELMGLKNEYVSLIAPKKGLDIQIWNNVGFSQYVKAFHQIVEESEAKR